MAYNIRATMRSVKNAVLAYSDIEVKVREATNNDPWGVSTTALAEIGRATNDYEEYPKLFAMTWKRLNDHEHVMHVQKALILIDYLLRNGAERFISDAKRRARDVQQLIKYKHYDPNTSRDDAGEARNKAKIVYELLTNDAKLTEERAKAQAIRDVNLQGISSDQIQDDRHDYEKNYDDVPKKKASAATNGFDEKPEDDWGSAPVEPKQKKPVEGEKKKKKKKKVVEETNGSGEATPAPPTPPQSSAKPAATFGDSFDFDAATSDPFGSSTTKPSTKATSAPATATSKLGEPAGEKTKRKKKNATAAAAAPAVSVPTVSIPSGDFDLSNFAVSTPREGQVSDIDILTGNVAPVGGNLVDAFSAVNLMDEPVDRSYDEDDGFEEEPALLDTKPYVDNTVAAAADYDNPTVAKKSDAWDLAGDITNLDNINSTAAKKKQTTNKMEVSMSMMRGMQVGGSSAATSQRSAPTQNPFFPSVGSAPMQPGMMQPGMMQAGMMQPMMMQPQYGQSQMPNFAMQMGMMSSAPSANQNAFGGDLPFAAAPGTAPKKSSGKPIIFDAVPQARPELAQAQPQYGAPKGPNWNR